MLIAVSVLLLLVTASGIVGMTSLWVTQRRKQIGVRRALGARRVDILRYFITENFMITSAGIVGGVLLALGAQPAAGAASSSWRGCRPATWSAARACSGCSACWRCTARRGARRRISPAIATRSA